MGELLRQPLMLGLDFHLISIFFDIAHFTKFKRGSSLFMEKSLLVEKSKAEETPWENIRKKKTGLKKKERVPFCQEKKKKSLCGSDWYWRSPRWRPDFEQRSRRQTQICYTWWSLLCRPPQPFTERSRLK